MPDLQTALEIAIKEWNDDINQPQETKMKPQIFKPTNNVTRMTFDYVKQNKGCSKAEVRTALMAKGFKDNSITSLLAQMLRQNYFILDKSGGLHCLIEEYVPLKAHKAKDKIAKPTVKKVKVKEPLKPVPVPVPMPEFEPGIKHLQSRSWTAEEILNKLNVVEAKALYKELTRVFSE